ncbi:hypothetical protein N018_15095 [Pseudomonas syringae CC1557]|uniref:Uncharacterized protein n=1 Tax=Pseudomonas syringae CC1557 TaxID=1357279 RepID=W0N2X6_PSESX|nr:hypothetical protein N018_15095 [Pseudomonas syringae CC1557]
MGSSEPDCTKGVAQMSDRTQAAACALIQGVYFFG